MRNYIVYTLLLVGVVTLSLSSMILATQVSDLQGQILELTSQSSLNR